MSHCVKNQQQKMHRPTPATRSRTQIAAAAAARLLAGRLVVISKAASMRLIIKTLARLQHQSLLLFIMSNMATSIPKKRQENWNHSDNNKFQHLIDKGIISLDNNARNYITSIRDKYWPQRSLRSFSNQWKKRIAGHEIEKAKGGKNTTGGT